MTILSILNYEIQFCVWYFNRILNLYIFTHGLYLLILSIIWCITSTTTQFWVFLQQNHLYKHVNYVWTNLSIVAVKEDWNNPLQRWWNVFCSWEPKHDCMSLWYCGRRAVIGPGLKPSAIYNVRDLPSRCMLPWEHIIISKRLGLGET